MKNYLVSSLVLLLLVGCGGSGGSDSKGNEESKLLSLYGFWQYKGYYQECRSTPAEGIAAFEDVYGAELLISGEDWHHNCKTSPLDQATPLLLINNLAAVSKDNFKDALLDAFAPAYEEALEIVIEEYSKDRIIFKLLDGRDDSTEVVELYKSNNNEKLKTLDIVGSWHYSLNYTNCLNKSEEGISTWTYSNNAYSMSTYTDNALTPIDCSYIGSDTTTSNGVYLANNPITIDQFEAGMNALNHVFVFKNTVFESEDKITLSVTVNNTYPATLTFTK